MVVPLLSLLLGGCESLGYYWQAGEGQWRIYRAQAPVGELVDSPQTAPELRERLIRSQAILEFAHQSLLLPDNGSYRHYADLKRPYVVWNLFASDEFSIQPHHWCYPLVGCLSYRGYFDPDSAIRAASRLQAQGMDTWVAGVRAYSTLGWLDDPLLNTFIEEPEQQLAELIFHELAHQRVFAAGDTEFNESLATVIADEGVRRWAALHHLPHNSEQAALERRAREQVVALVKQTRERLDRLYREDLPTASMRDQKQRLLDQLRTEYQQLRLGPLQRHARYDRWMAGTLNNAKLATIASYHRWVPQIEALLKQQGGDLDALYRALEELAALSADKRKRVLSTHPKYNQ
ncbi:aminopeptidase [Aestuariirhabdus litorea]|uniref:aminopeptidase n=1 Tax=Aestuariirhabdus litorea TaxID=2528527 RepID=UPI0013E2ED56|nr:aminopeptidase [Aestuariirhabdus litorea]